MPFEHDIGDSSSEINTSNVKLIDVPQSEWATAISLVEDFIQSKPHAKYGYRNGIAYRCEGDFFNVYRNKKSVVVRWIGSK